MNPGRGFLLVVVVFLATSIMVECQSLKQPRTNDNNRQQQSALDVGDLPPQISILSKQSALDSTMAPFFSIKDGKTSARRIQQQNASQQVAHSAKPNGVSSRKPLGDDLNVDKVSINSPSKPTEQQVMNEIQQQFSMSTPEDIQISSMSTTMSPEQQRQMAISSFNQLVGAGALDDFFGSSGQSNGGANDFSDRFEQLSSQQPSNNDTSNIATTPGPQTSSEQQRQQQIQQFTTATGSSISNPPSSLSMSLDGMIVNSRPRASLTSSKSRGSTSKQNNKQMSQRLGESARPKAAGLSDSNQGKAPRRVPLTGVPFSSPASKGKGVMKQTSSFLNQPDEQINNQFSTDGPVALKIGSKAANISLNGRGTLVREPINGQIGDEFNSISNSLLGSQQQSGDFSQQGFDEDSQQLKQATAIEQASDSNLPSDLSMKNIFSNTNANNRNQQQQPIQSEQMQLRNNVGQQNNADEMVMSLVSSPDGKERRLIMIARNTLDSLQKFAAAQNQMREQQQRLQATKSNTNNNNNNWIGQLRDRTNTESLPANSFNNEQNNNNMILMNIWKPSSSSINSPSQSAVNFMDDQQQSQLMDSQFQTTTQAPSAFSSPFITTTQQPKISPQTSSSLSSDILNQNNRGQEVVQMISETPTFFVTSGSDSNRTSSTTTMPSAFTQQTSTDSSILREVPLSTLAAANQPANFQSSLSSSGQMPGSQRAKQALSSGSTKSGSSKQTSSSSSSSNTGKKVSRPSSNAGGSTGKKSGKQINGAAKLNNPSANAKSSSQKSLKSISKSSSSPSSSNSLNRKSFSGPQTSASKKTTGNVSPASSASTNAQQKPAALMMARALEQLQQAGKQRQTLVDEVGSSELSTLAPRSGAPSSTLDTIQQQLQDGDSSTTTITSQVSQVTKQTQIQTNEQQNSQRGSNPSSGKPVDTGSEQAIRSNSFDRQIDEMERQSGDVSGIGTNQQSVGSRTIDSNDSNDSKMSASSSLDGLRNAIPGEPTQDYPIYSSPPQTSFSCKSQSCPAGYYADPETQCQVFHICQNDGRFDTFLCPNGTIFSQQHFVCVWWWQVDCQQSSSFYKLNDNIYCNSISPEVGGISSGVEFANRATDSPSNVAGTRPPTSGSMQNTLSSSNVDDSSQPASTPNPSSSSSPGSSPASFSSSTSPRTPVQTSNSAEARDQSAAAGLNDDPGQQKVTSGFASSTSSSLMRPTVGDLDSDDQSSGSQQQVEVPSSKKKA